jgi:hypothetical protein
MNKMLKLSLVTSLIFIGCGGGSGSGNSNSNKINGKVVDGYVKNAKVCVDLNNNFSCDENEPFTYTDENGNYSLEIDNKDYILISTGGIDTETNRPALTMYSNTKYKNITPLTSLAIKLGEDIVSEFYNIDKSKIATDPMKNNEIKNIVRDIVNTKIITGKFILPTNHILVDNRNINEKNETSEINNTITNDKNITDENTIKKEGGENIPPQITGNLTPPQIGE